MTINIHTTLDLYASARTNKCTQIDERAFHSIIATPEVQRRIADYRQGNAEAKRLLPAVTYMGRSRSGKRQSADMEPTGFVMLDIDHIPSERMSEAIVTVKNRAADIDLLLLHTTPSGQGLRIVWRMADASTHTFADVDDYCRHIVTEQARVAELLGMADFGHVDTVCKDLTRMSFVPQQSDVHYINAQGLFRTLAITLAERPDAAPAADEAPSAPAAAPAATPDGAAAADKAPSAAAPAGGAVQPGHYADFNYGGVPVRKIAEEYVEWKGEPEEGCRHNFYNQMVIDFRGICNNSPQILIDVLPLLGADRRERMSQCESLCKRNTSPKLPRDFYFWLERQGYYVDRAEEMAESAAARQAQNAYAEEHRMLDCMPELPPVFREFVSVAPREFKIPTLFALCPVIGTVATYLSAEYYDETVQTPTFFTIIEAHAAEGKSFVKRIFSLDADRTFPANLLDDIVRRDCLSNARMNLWNEFTAKKGANDKGKTRPKVSTRIMEVITSQADMLPVIKDNQGMHAFMFAPEVDTLIKGMRAGGNGDKSDLYRMAFDNDAYGQSYRNSGSFRGKVPLYLNMLVTGTPGQSDKLFTNVEDGSVMRWPITDLGQQAFAPYQPWGKLSVGQQRVIANWRARCDAETYTSPMRFDLEALDDYTDEKKFDADVPWEYVFRGRKRVKLDYVNRALLKWVEEQRVIAERDADYARDAFRKRSAMLAFRVALLCCSCWKRVTRKEQKIILDFALWMADLFLMKFLKRWGMQYNEMRAASDNRRADMKQPILFDALPMEFTKGEVALLAKKTGKKTPVRKIISMWRTSGLIEDVRTDVYRKVTEDEAANDEAAEDKELTHDESQQAQ